MNNSNTRFTNYENGSISLMDALDGRIYMSTRIINLCNTTLTDNDKHAFIASMLPKLTHKEIIGIILVIKHTNKYLKDTYINRIEELNCEQRHNIHRFLPKED